MSRTTANMKYNLARYMVTLQIFLGLAIINATVASVYGNAVTPEIPTVSDNESEFPDIAMVNDAGLDEKRSWQSLQGAWGKRSNQDLDDTDTGDMDHIMPVLVTNMDPRSHLQMAYLTNGATLEHLANPQRFAGSSMESIADMDDSILNEKRAWKSMNVAWGKRRNGPTWNKFRGAWGKREPNWNNLKGMWGKRSSKDWQKLQGGWGKRSQQFPEMN